jgi:hypothetical protein
MLFILFAWGCEKGDIPGDGDKDDDDKVEINWNDAANSSSDALISSFWNSSGQYFNTNNVQEAFHYEYKHQHLYLQSA